MPNQLIQVAPELVVEHNHIKVYRTYNNDEFDDPEMFHFTLREDETDSSTYSSFDVRELDVPAAKQIETDAPAELDYPRIRRLGMVIGAYKKTPAYLELAAKWETWLEVTRPALIVEALRQAADAGLLDSYS